MNKSTLITGPENDEKTIIISADDARGAAGPTSGSRGDTLLPMLIVVLVLTLVGVSIVAFLTFGKPH